MPRLIEDDETLIDLHTEIDYTHARLSDEPLTQPFAARTADWTSRIEAADREVREVAREDARIDAARQGANAALDDATVAFADALYLDVKKDRVGPRWRGFFRDSVSAHVRQSFPTQVATTRGWLSGSSDPILEQHRDRLSAAVTRAEQALARQNTLATRRATLWQARVDLARFLTAERDALHDELSHLGRMQGFARTWPNTFFRTGLSRVRRAKEAATAESATTEAPKPTI